MTQTMTAPPDGATQLPYAKYKPGMRVYSAVHHQLGTVVKKHKGTDILFVLFDGRAEGDTTMHAAVELWLVPVDPLDQIHPMLAKNIKDYSDLTVEQLVEDDQWVMEKKYDGERAMLTFVPNEMRPAGEGGNEFTSYALSNTAFRATSRVVGKNTGRLGVNTFHLPDQGELLALVVPEEGATVFDSELTHTKFGGDDEANFKLVASIMRSLAPLARTKQAEHGPLSIRLYDLLWFNGKDLREHPFWARRRTLEVWYAEVVERLSASDDRSGLTLFTQLVQLSPQATTTEQKRDMLERSATEGWEGEMCKHLDGVYTDTSKKEQRSAHLLKDKPFQDTEVIITAFEGGKGEYNTNQFGAMRFAQWIPRSSLTTEMVEHEVREEALTHPNIRSLLGAASSTGLLLTHMLVEVGTASGFDQKEEAEFRAAPDAFIAAVATVKFQKRQTSSGRMRHPHFKAIRATPALEVIYTPER